MIHGVRFPNETDEYRQCRNELLRAEFNLRNQIEEVASRRRQLPLGGKLNEDYTFAASSVGQSESLERPLSSLFEDGKNTLLIYSFMFSPKMERPCPMCTSFIDGLNGNARHFLSRINFAVVAKSPIDRILEFATAREWKHINLLSSYNNLFNKDYNAETESEEQLPVMHVFRQKGDEIFHFYSSELEYCDLKGEQPRHMDLMWPLWNVLDLTPEGRGENWYPSLSL